jgi:hypothetical protein
MKGTVMNSGNKVVLLDRVEELISTWGFDAVQHTLNFIRDYPVVFNTRFTDNNGMSYTLTYKQFEKVRNAYANGLGKIQAIKEFREITSCGLKDAKDAIESYSWTQV